jgi:hypothetical protein
MVHPHLALIFHYSETGTHRLTCEQLSSEITDRYLAHAHVSDVHANDRWIAIDLLQWILISDGCIIDLAERCTELRLNNSFELVQRAMRELIAEWRIMYETTADLSDNNLAQIIALGRAMATMTAESPDMIAYTKNEAQPVDLAKALHL